MITNMKASRKLNRRKKTTEDIKAWLLMLPAVFIIYTLIWRPTVLGGAYSFFNMQGYTVGDFCGLKNYIQVEMSRYVQSKNPLNPKYTQYRICFSEWSVAKRGKTDSRAAVLGCGFSAAV